MKYRLRKGFKKWAEEVALNYRKELNLKNYEPLPANLLADHLGIIIVMPNQILDVASSTIKNLKSGYSKWSAITLLNKYGEIIIIHNPAHSKYRRESNLMHEIAHVLCKHTPEEFGSTKNFPFLLLRDYNIEQEQEAQWLGACLQLPRKAIEWALKNGMKETEISNYFNASKDMVRFRKNITGISKQYSYLKNIN